MEERNLNTRTGGADDEDYDPDDPSSGVSSLTENGSHTWD